MKKLIFSSLLAAYLILSSAQAFAYPKTPANFRDATWLSKEENMTSDFKRPKGTVPVGTIIAWNSETMPKDESWTECNGVWPASICKGTECEEYQKLFGQTIPNYQGFFLRGHGKFLTSYKSAGLNEIQFATELDHTHYVGKRGAADIGGHHSGSTTVVTPWSTGGAGAMSEPPIWNDDALNVSHSGHLGQQQDVRPLNKAVKYLIKVK